MSKRMSLTHFMKTACFGFLPYFQRPAADPSEQNLWALIYPHFRLRLMRALMHYLAGHLRTSVYRSCIPSAGCTSAKSDFRPYPAISWVLFHIPYQTNRIPVYTLLPLYTLTYLSFSTLYHIVPYTDLYIPLRST